MALGTHHCQEQSSCISCGINGAVTVQLPLPFHPPVIAPMSEREREMLKQALAQLLLEAIGVTQEGSNDG